MEVEKKKGGLNRRFDTDARTRDGNQSWSNYINPPNFKDCKSMEICCWHVRKDDVINMICIQDSK